MSKFKTVFLTVFFALAVICSCTFNKVEDIQPCFAEDDTTTWSFQDTILPMITRYCSDPTNGDCHQQGVTDRPELIDYPSIKTQVDDGRIKARLIDQAPSAMPPPQTVGPAEVPRCEKEVVLRWIEDGAPDN